MNIIRTRIVPAVLIAALLLTICACGKKTEQQTGTDEAESAAQIPQTPRIDEASAISIVFSGDGAETAADKETVKVDGGDVTIRAAGTYTLSGSGSGSVTVKKETQGVVLVLSGLELNSDGAAAICCNKGTEVTILAAEGTVNTLTDSEKNNDETYPDSETAENAVIKCKDGSRVLLCGTGVLNVNANGKNGIKGGETTEEAGEASLTVTELTLNVTSVDDGIKSDSALAICSGTITVSAGDDAVGSDDSVTVGASDGAGPALTVSDCTEGVEAPQVRILSGNVDISASDDGLNAVAETGTADITIAGGTVRIDAANGDGLDSNGTVNITGGDIRVFSSSRSDNSPLDYGTDMSITGGTVLAVGSSGMAQPPNAAAQTYVVFSAGNSIGGPKGGPGGSKDAQSIDFSLAAGDKLQILDGDGAVLAEAEAPRTADYVYFSSPELAEGQTCALSVNGQSVGTAAATTELSAVGGIPDAGGNGGQPQKPDGDFDPDNMPQMPSGGEFDPDNMPQMPDGGNFDPNNMPQPPEGGFDPNNMPQRPEGDFDPGNMPQPPGGFSGNGGNGQTGATPDAGDGNDL